MFFEITSQKRYFGFHLISFLQYRNLLYIIGILYLTDCLMAQIGYQVGTQDKEEMQLSVKQSEK